MSHSDDQRNPLTTRQLRYLRLACGGVLILLAGYGALVYPQVARRAYDDEIEKMIYGMRSRRPAELSRGQWSEAVGWTGQLHGNSQLWIEADARVLAAFQARFRKKLEDRINLQTIDWIWDEYSRLTPHGQSYQKFKEVMDEQIAAAAKADSDPWNIGVP